MLLWFLIFWFMLRFVTLICVSLLGLTNVESTLSQMMEQPPLTSVNNRKRCFAKHNRTSRPWNQVKRNQRKKDCFSQITLTRSAHQRTTRMKLHTHRCRAQFYKAQTVPYAMKEKVEKELECLQAQKNITPPVEYSHWATHIVPEEKHDGTIRLCGEP